MYDVFFLLYHKLCSSHRNYFDEIEWKVSMEKAQKRYCYDSLLTLAAMIFTGFELPAIIILDFQLQLVRNSTK